jgi:hypothetical protein
MIKERKYLILTIILLIILFLFLILNNNNKYDNFENSNTFDLIIPYGPNDDWIIQKCIDSCKKYVVGVKNIYVIAYKNVQLNNCIVISEKKFPFTKDYVANKTSKERAGWYLQQLIKFYIPRVISSISENFLIVDADTVFYKETTYIEDDKILYDTSVQNHTPYFDHMKRLHPILKKYHNRSGICDQMMFNKKILEELLQLVENYHKKEFYDVFLDSITDKVGSGASEYEIYFNYIIYKYKNTIKERELKKTIKSKYEETNNEFNYINYHYYQMSNKQDW